MKKISLLSLFIYFVCSGYAQVDKEMKMIAQVKATSVKDQQKTGTCWDFATASFFEAEALRLGKNDVDLSEMFIARQVYLKKAITYVRFQGSNSFSEGGQAHDVLNVIRENGLMPQEQYLGLNYGTNYHIHSEMVAGLKGFLDGIMKGDQKKLSTAWTLAVESSIDAYLGKIPQNFVYKGKTYSPQSFASEVVGINPDDYVELTSYSHHPFYKSFAMEIPDNWAHENYYNLPIDELLQVAENAVKTGYSVAWDGDVSESEFMHESGKAIINEINEKGLKYSIPEVQKLRQETFNNWTTTDDHLMHITGLATDRNGSKFYYTKNSWGSESNSCGGYLYISEAYLQQKTIAILVHKKAIPEAIAKKIFGK